MKHLLIKTLVAAMAVATVGMVSAQEKVIKFATQNPKGHPITLGMEKFADIVNAKAAGKLKVNLFPAGALGSDQANVSALQGGTLEMVSMNSGILTSQVKDFTVYDLPFMFANEKEADAVVDGAFGKKMHAKLDAVGIVGLGYYELGFRNITNSKRAITKVEDIAGLKLRVIPNAINVDWVNALGANPTPLPFPEVFAALETKAIDGQENPIAVINANKFFEVQKYVTLTNHQYNPQSVLMSKKFWDTLDMEEKKIISDAVAESSKFQRVTNRGAIAGALDNMKKNGMQVSEFSASETAKLTAKMLPVISKHAGLIGGDTVTELLAELGKLRK